MTKSQMRGKPEMPKPVKRVSLRTKEKRKQKEWERFLGFMRKNPESMMSLVDVPIPSLAETE